MENNQTENFQGNTGAWFNKENWKDMRLIFNPEETPPEGFVRAQPLHGIEYQIYDEESGEWVADPDADRLARIAGCKAGLAEIDRETGAGRAVRKLALESAERAGETGGQDYARLKGREERAEALRETLAGLTGEGAE
jgi:hypothetical protein